MSGVSLDLTVEGADVTARRFMYMAERFDPAHMLEMNAAVMKALEEYHKKTWGRGVKDVPGTLRRWPDQQGPLWLTGHLRASMVSSDAPGAVRKIAPLGIEYGTDIVYGRFVNDGTRKMSPKPFMKFNTPMKTIIRNIFWERLRLAGESVEGFPSPGTLVEE